MSSMGLSAPGGFAAAAAATGRLDLLLLLSLCGAWMVLGGPRGVGGGPFWHGVLVYAGLAVISRGGG